MIYTPVEERRGSFVTRYIMDVTRYSGIGFGYHGYAMNYWTPDDLPFCMLIYSDKPFTGWFETHEKGIIHETLFELFTK